MPLPGNVPGQRNATDLHRNVGGERALLDRNSSGTVQRTATASTTNTTNGTVTFTVTASQDVAEDKLTYASAGGTSATGTILRNGSTVVSFTGGATTTTNVLSTTERGPVNYTVKVTTTAGTPTKHTFTANRGQRVV